MSRSPGEPLPTTVARLVADANRIVPPLPLDRARPLLDDPTVRFVDIREPQEWTREGIIPGAYRAPRGMLEFWIDPDSPYYRAGLDDGRRLILYCGSAWRSALAAESLSRMGLDTVTHLEGGFSAWRDAGHPVEPYSPPPPRPEPDA